MSLLDPLLTVGRPYHLVQAIPFSRLASPDNPYGDTAPSITVCVEN